MENIYCKITINKNIIFVINIHSNQHKWKNEIIKYLNNLESIMIKPSSIIINCDLDSIYIKDIINFIFNFKNDNIKNLYNNFTNIVLELNNDDFFSQQSNINMFYFIDNIIIGKDYKNLNLDFKLFQNLKKIKFNTDPTKFMNLIPFELDEFIFNDKYNKPIEQLSTNLKTLILPRCFDNKINIQDSNIKYLICNNIYNLPVTNLPNSLHMIKFGSEFNQLVDNLPESIKEITFGRKFNQCVDNLPSSLTYLSFDNDFNQIVSNLPNGLIYIYFKSNSQSNCKFNQSINNLPESIEEIILINEKYSKPINKLPKSLKKIKISIKYAYSQYLSLKLDNILNKTNIKNIIKKQNLNCEIEIG